MPGKQAAVAMSGGVDSSVAAALLKDAGYDLIGVTLSLMPSANEASQRARAVAARLNIPHHVIDAQDEFARKVVSEFCREYRQGRTPNPCIACNEHIKFGLLLNRVRQMGVDLLATGHYARRESAADGYHLLKAADKSKDQSYFLYRLGQKQLEDIIFPLGSRRKAEVREMAERLELPVARRSSQDICFITDRDYRQFIQDRLPQKPGDIIDTEGKVLGRHKGLAHYTVGQRQGLGISASQPLYVLKLDAAGNRLVVGRQDYLLSNRLVAGSLSWVAGKAPEDLSGITAKVRYKSRDAAAIIHLKDGTAEACFEKPLRAITPGQSVVFYRGDEVLGGGIIEESGI